MLKAYPIMFLHCLDGHYATREKYYQKKTQYSSRSDIQTMGEGNVKQNRGEWEKKTASVLVKISDNTKKNQPH